jgi:hypothetical protein
MDASNQHIVMELRGILMCVKKAGYRAGRAAGRAAFARELQSDRVMKNRLAEIIFERRFSQRARHASSS